MKLQSFWHEFRPRSLEVLHHYTLHMFQKDALAGITVGIVAIPLALAFAIASGVNPGQGLITAIVAGFFISLLGGSKMQIGGPTGAFIVVIYGVVQAHGYSGLVIATFMAGLILIAAGLLRLGNLMKYIPAPVVVGFTAGIAAIIFSGQIKEFFGLNILHLPASAPAQWEAYAHSFSTLNLTTTAVAVLALALIVAMRALKSPIPPAIMAVMVCSLLVYGMGLPVETIGSKFGGIPQQLPQFSWPQITYARVHELLPSAITIALLAAIESLLSALVADGLSGDKHKSNAELVGQGVANIASVLFGGIAATGAIARTGVNVKSGGQTPVSGMVHAAFLLAVMLLLAPLASQIPLAALAAVLFITSWDMSERHHVARLIHEHKAPALVMATTFFLTVFVDLTQAVLAGTLMSLVLTHHRTMLNPKEALKLLEVRFKPETKRLHGKKS